MPLHAIASELSNWMHRWFAPQAGTQVLAAPLLDELRRAWSAERRYETLRFDPQARDTAHAGRAGVARQVFDEIYAQAPAAPETPPATRSEQPVTTLVVVPARH